MARIRVFPLCQWCGERNDRPWLRICSTCAQGTISRLRSEPKSESRRRVGWVWLRDLDAATCSCQYWLKKALLGSCRGGAVRGFNADCVYVCV